MANVTGFTVATNPARDVLEGGDYCDHCTMEDHSKMVGFFYERDSFGYVGCYIVCAECRATTQAQVDESIEICADCGMPHQKKFTREWRWYDFYAPQGDEPRIVCNTCWGLPKHQQRMANDKLDYEQEFGQDEPDWDYPDDDDRIDDDMDEFFDEECEEQDHLPIQLVDIKLEGD